MLLLLTLITYNSAFDTQTQYNKELHFTVGNGVNYAAGLLPTAARVTVICATLVTGNN
jgi:hypothetical protein